MTHQRPPADRSTASASSSAKSCAETRSAATPGRLLTARALVMQRAIGWQAGDEREIEMDEVPFAPR